MTEIHIVDAIARTPECTTEAVYQYAYGLELRITGIDLPEAFEVQQCNDGDTETKTAVGQDGVVRIYDEYLETGKDIFCYLFLHDDETDGRTVRKITIPVKRREPPSDLEPTPVQQDAITQAIGAMQAARADIEQIAEDAHQAIEDALDETVEETVAEKVAEAVEEAKQSGDFKGDKGDKGDTGEQGPKGDKGDKGDTGSDATVTKDSIMTALGYDVGDDLTTLNSATTIASDVFSTEIAKPTFLATDNMSKAVIQNAFGVNAPIVTPSTITSTGVLINHLNPRTWFVWLNGTEVEFSRLGVSLNGANNAITLYLHGRTSMCTGIMGVDSAWTVTAL
ncbi:MAG: collagen-like protein [Blautia sp.]|nr:collagen-like protein [Blautia sp.]